MPNSVSTIDQIGEVPLVRAGLHWGIITPAIILGIFLIALSIPIVLFFKFASNLMAQFNPKGQALDSILGFWVLLPVISLFGITLSVTVVAYFTSEITLTDRRLAIRTGFFSRHSGELPLENIESIFLFESFIGRIFGYGTITVTSAGGGTFPLNYICSPKSFHGKLQSAVNNAKNPRQVTEKSQNPPQDDSRYMPKASKEGQ